MKTEDLEKSISEAIEKIKEVRIKSEEIIMDNNYTIGYRLKLKDAIRKAWDLQMDLNELL